MAESLLINTEQESGSEVFTSDPSGKSETIKTDNNVNGDDTVSENSNASSCGELSTSLKTQWNESASLSDSNSRGNDVQTQIRQKLRGLSPVKRRIDSNAQDSKRSKQRTRISQIMSGGSYRSKRDLFTKLFVLNKGLPVDEQLIADFSCALQRDILVHGRLYLSQNWMCFYANIIGWETVVTINWTDITAVTKEKTARVIPNAIQVNTSTDKYFLTSFVSRENSYRSLFRIWQNALMGQPNSPQHLRNLCKPYTRQSRPRDEIDSHPGNDHDEAEETGDEATENETGQEDDRSYTASEISQEIGQDQGLPAMEGQEGGATKISVIPPSPTASDTPGTENVLERSTDGSHSPGRTPMDMSKDDSVLPPRPVSPFARRAEHLMNMARRRRRPKLKPTQRTLVQITPLSLPVPDADAGESTEMEEEGSISSDEDQGDVLCPCHDSHSGKEYIVEDYNFDVDALYEHLFSKDSDLMKGVQKESKMYDFAYGNFERMEGGGTSRTITYMLSLNYSIGPKNSPTTMKQIYHKDNKPGSFYIIDTEVKNQGIPYSDSFYVHNRYCLTRMFGNRSRMRVHAQVVQLKTVVGFMKNMILRNADEALVDYFNLLGNYLRQESDLLPNVPPSKSTTIPPKESLMENIAPGETISSHNIMRTKESSTSPTPPRETVLQPSLSSPWIGSKMPTLTSLLLLMLLCLLSMNTYLFYRLYRLETIARAEQLCSQRILPTSHEEWHKLMQHQKHAYNVEIKRLKDVIGGTAQLVKQVEKSISHLYKELEDSHASNEATTDNFLRQRDNAQTSSAEA